MRGLADPRRADRGFSLLEILIAMAIFSVLGTMVVFFLRQSLDIFYTGTRESAQLDRQDSVLPQIRVDLSSLVLPPSFQAPAPPPDDAVLDRRGQAKPPPPPPVWVRVRAGYLKLKQVTIEGYKDYPCPYFAFVVADAGEWSSRLKRRAGETPVQGKELQALTPKTVREGDKDTRYLPTGGLTEVVWIAVPEAVMRDEGDMDRVSFPGILTLYRGYRTPIGHPEKSLLLPESLDTPAKIKASCTKIADGLVHFGATWRRVFAENWDTELGIGLGEKAPYVGPIWDSTRALDKDWPLHKGPQSLGDPSDDIFPAFVRLEATLAALTQFGPGRGELRLQEGCTVDQTEIVVGNTDLLMQPNLGKERWIKIDREWMQYEVRDVDYTTGKVRVRRGMRGTKKEPHSAGDWCYIGTVSTLEMRLPMFRDTYVLREENR